MKTVAEYNRNVPKLRFPEFDEEWKPTTVGQVSKRPSYGMNAAAKKFDGKHKYIRITDISDEDRSFAPNPLTSPEPPVSEEYKLKQGDIVFARTGASTGKSYLYKKDDGDLYFAGFLIRFSIEKADPRFVFAQSLRSEFAEWVSVTSMRSGQPGINAQEYSAFAFTAPSFPEQQKIAAFLGAVDDKIAQLQKKRALLEAYKSACMQKLFSREFRFKDEQGCDFPDWEEKRLGDVVTFSKGRGVSKSDLVENGTTPCIRYGEVYTHYREHIVDVYSSTNTQRSSLLLSQARDVIIPASGEDRLDMARACCVEDEGVALGGDLNVLRGAEDGVFLAYYLNNAKKKEIARFAQGYSVVHLYGSHLKNLLIELPHPDEQRKIADFLSALDIKFDLLAKEIDHARSFKIGLLQQMFV